jgi:hypothetical protein
MPAEGEEGPFDGAPRKTAGASCLARVSLTPRCAAPLLLLRCSCARCRARCAALLCATLIDAPRSIAAAAAFLLHAASGPVRAAIILGTEINAYREDAQSTESGRQGALYAPQNAVGLFGCCFDVDALSTAIYTPCWSFGSTRHRAEMLKSGGDGTELRSVQKFKDVAKYGCFYLLCPCVVGALYRGRLKRDFAEPTSALGVRRAPPWLRLSSARARAARAPPHLPPRSPPHPLPCPRLRRRNRIPSRTFCSICSATRARSRRRAARW